MRYFFMEADGLAFDIHDTILGARHDYDGHLAKNIHGIYAAAGKVVPRRGQMEKFWRATADGSRDEACGGAPGAHVFKKAGHEVRITPPAYVKLTSSAARTTDVMPKEFARRWGGRPCGFCQ